MDYKGEGMGANVDPAFLTYPKLPLFHRRLGIYG